MHKSMANNPIVHRIPVRNGLVLCAGFGLKGGPIVQPIVPDHVPNSKVMFSLFFALICAICTIVILVDAFKDSVLKGLICIFCWFYFIFYALFEFKHENKLLLVIGSFFGGGVVGLLRFLGH